MKADKLYLSIYKYLDNKTPLKYDCGKLCKKACCKGDDDTGMYLFPSEETVYSEPPKWARIETSDFQVDEQNVKILICNGVCDRKLRPLACRIFPLTPYVHKGKLGVIIDPRGRGICPLTAVDKDFYNAVLKVSKLLYKIKETKAFIDKISKQIDEYGSPNIIN